MNINVVAYDYSVHEENTNRKKDYIVCILIIPHLRLKYMFCTHYIKLTLYEHIAFYKLDFNTRNTTTNKK